MGRYNKFVDVYTSREWTDLLSPEHEGSKEDGDLRTFFFRNFGRHSQPLFVFLAELNSRLEYGVPRRATTMSEFLTKDKSKVSLYFL